MDENNSTPKPWEEPVAPPVEQPTPATPVEPQPESVEPQPELTPAPEEKPAEKPKKDNKLVLILVGVLVLIAIIAGVVIIASGNNSKNTRTTTTTTTTTTSSSKDDDKEEESDSDKTAQTINEQITADVNRVTTAINQYQANNRGAIPTIEISNKEDEADPKSWQYFINNYLDINSGGQQTQFTDTYQVKVCNYYEGTCPKLADLNWQQNKYTIYIAVRATCSATGEVEMNEGTRHVAVFSIKKPYSTMTNKFVCMNN